MVLFALTATLLCFFVVIAAYDIKHKIIPDFFSYGAAIIALVILVITSYAKGSFNIYDFLAGPIFFLFFFFFWFISKGTWMGLGDGKLALSIGWFLGLGQGIAAFLFSFWIGAIISILLMTIQKVLHKKGALGMKSEIPFGPFILIGFMVVYIWGIDVQTVLTYLAV
jgi:prepilin signal peptidase PulO-like enzyme (type II secretory pathway)